MAWTLVSLSGSSKLLENGLLPFLPSLLPIPYLGRFVEGLMETLTGIHHCLLRSSDSLLQAQNMLTSERQSLRLVRARLLAYTQIMPNAQRYREAR